MDKVSIIVPVYGVEAYLEACVDSLLAQSYENLEIILVDDASPDQCPGICDTYMAKDTRVMAIHKNNGGAASARNLGLDRATGEYVCFVDSDDTVDQDYVARLLDAVGDGDAAVCGYALLQPGKCTVQNVELEGVYSGKAFLAQFLESWRCALIWNKIFRRRTIGNIRFPEGHRIDDEFFTYRVIANCRKVTVIPDPLYYYRLRSSSVMHNLTSQQQIAQDRIDYLAQRLAFVAEAFPELEQDFLEDLLDSYARLRRSRGNMPAVSRAVQSWAWHNILRILSLQRPLKRRCVLLWQLFGPSARKTEAPAVEVKTEDYFA